MRGEKERCSSSLSLSPCRPVTAGTIVSYFNGVRIKEADVFDGTPNEKRSVYLVEIGLEDDYLDVPRDMAEWENYQASTGHKINHNPEAPGDYADCDHPRFGRIHCYVVKKVKQKWKNSTQHHLNATSRSFAGFGGRCRAVHQVRRVLRQEPDEGHSQSRPQRRTFLQWKVKKTICRRGKIRKISQKVMNDRDGELSQQVRPLLNAASKLAGNIKVDSFLQFS